MFDILAGQLRVAVNAIGHSAGLLVFGNFLFLVLWNRPGRRAYTSKLAIAAAALAFVWNLASLVGIAIGDETTVAGRAAAVVAFGALSCFRRCC